MKKPGLVGGMGPESTIPYYHGIVYGVQKALGGSVFPELSIESVNVFKVLRLCGEKKYDEMTDYLLAAVRNLAGCGADFAVLTANTPHIIFDRLRELSPIPMISIVEATSTEAKRRGYGKIGLLGTVFTMTGDFYREPFTESGIEIVVPSESDMQMINEKISSELEFGVVKPETLDAFQKVILKMKEKDGIEAVVLGCTELPLILNDDVSPVPCLDTVQIHIKEIVKMILEQ